MKVAEVYSKATDKRIDSVKRSYSIDDSDGRDWADDIYEDEHGNLYTKEEFQQLFPLESWKRDTENLYLSNMAKLA